MPCSVQQPREQQAGRTGPDDAYLGAHGAECDRRRRPAGNRILPVSGSRGCGPARGRCRGRPPPAPARGGGGRGGAGGRRCPGRPPRPARRGRSTCTGTASDAAPGDISSDVRAYRRRRTSASSRRSRPGSTTVCRVIRVSERSACSTTSCGAAASSTLPTPVACSGSRLPTWLTTGHRLAAGDPLDVEGAQPVADGEVHGVADRGVHVQEERGGHLAQLELHRREQAEVPELAADLVAAVRRAGPARPSRSARRAAGARWSAGCPSARRSPTGTAAGA